MAPWVHDYTILLLVLVTKHGLHSTKILNFVPLSFFFSEPNDESGANVDASKMWREDRDQFNKLAHKIVRKSLGL